MKAPQELKYDTNRSKTKTYECKRCSKTSYCRYTGKNIYCSRGCAAKDMANVRSTQYKTDESIRNKISVSWIKKGQRLSPDTEFKVGNTPWHKGRINVYTESQLTRITEANQKNAVLNSGENSHLWKGGKSKCIDCSKLLKHYRQEARCRSCSNIYYSGNNSWAWDGGKTSKNRLERIKFRDTIRKQVLERDEYKCVICNSGGYLHVDHVKSWSRYPELRFAEDNCRTLCRYCHYYATFKKIMPIDSVWGLSNVTENRG